MLVEKKQDKKIRSFHNSYLKKNHFLIFIKRTIMIIILMEVPYSFIIFYYYINHAHRSAYLDCSTINIILLLGTIVVVNLILFSLTGSNKLGLRRKKYKIELFANSIVIHWFNEKEMVKTKIPFSNIKKIEKLNLKKKKLMFRYRFFWGGANAFIYSYCILGSNNENVVEIFLRKSIKKIYENPSYPIIGQRGPIEYRIKEMLIDIDDFETLISVFKEYQNLH